MKRDVMQELDSRLRGEARGIRQRNGFSPLLHERIMQALRAQGLATTPVMPERRFSAWRIAGSLATAAAVALAAWIVLRPAPPRPPGPSMVHTRPANDMPSVPVLVAAPRLDPTSAALEERKYAYLDRDAQRLMAFLADQIPQFPEGK